MSILHEKIVNHFGPYAGYAQQFLYSKWKERITKRSGCKPLKWQLIARFLGP